MYTNHMAHSGTLVEFFLLRRYIARPFWLSATDAWDAFRPMQVIERAFFFRSGMTLGTAQIVHSPLHRVASYFDDIAI